MLLPRFSPIRLARFVASIYCLHSIDAYILYFPLETPYALFDEPKREQAYDQFKNSVAYRRSISCRARWRSCNGHH